MHALAPCVLAALGSVLAGQQTLVSPLHYADQEGTTLSGQPFSGVDFPVRFQQVHGDIRGAVRTITAVAWRRDGLIGDDPRLAPRSVDAELWMAAADIASVGPDFNGNHRGAPVNAIARRLISTPDYSSQRRSVPAPFDFVLPFDVPFVAPAGQDLLWDLTVHRPVGPEQVVALDAAWSGASLVVPASYRMNGTGCTVLGAEMQVRPAISLQGFPVDGWILDWTVRDAPHSSPAVMMVGTVDPMARVNGLCTEVRVLPLVTVVGVTDAAGGFDPFPPVAPLPRLPYRPALVGAQFEAQAVVVDNGRPGLQLAASNGVSSWLPPGSPAFAVTRVVQVGAAAPVVTAGSGLPTRFSF